MRIGADLERAAERLRELTVSPIEIEPMRIGIDLQRHLFRRCLRDHRRQIDRVGLAAEQQPPRRVSEDRYVRIVERVQHARRHRLPIHREARVHRRDHVIESIEQLGIIVYCAVRENVRLDALEHEHAGIARIQAIYLFVLRAHCVGLESARIERGLRMV